MALYNMLQAEPDSLGAGSTDVAALAFRVWKGDGARDATVISLAAMTAEQVAQNCKRLPEVQVWTNEAAAALASLRTTTGPQSWGMAVHKQIETTIKALKEQYPARHADIAAEWSLDSSGDVARYGQLGSSRLDVLELRPDVACVYDIKTGYSGISADQLRRISNIVARYGKPTFFIVEIRPFQ